MVGNVEEVLRSEDADIIDQDVGRRLGANEDFAARRRAEVGGHAADHGAGHGVLQRGDRFVHCGLGSAVDHRHRARLSQALGDGEADADRRAGDDGGLVREIYLHRDAPCGCRPWLKPPAGWRARRSRRAPRR
jgi:hypothetical protein